MEANGDSDDIGATARSRGENRLVEFLEKQLSHVNTVSLRNAQENNHDSVQPLPLPVVLL